MILAVSQKAYLVETAAFSYNILLGVKEKHFYFYNDLLMGKIDQVMPVLLSWFLVNKSCCESVVDGERKWLGVKQQKGEAIKCIIYITSS